MQSQQHACVENHVAQYVKKEPCRPIANHKHMQKNSDEGSVNSSSSIHCP